MLASYKEKKYLIISFIVLILDGLIIYFYPFYFSHLTLFYPMLTLSLIPFLYQYNVKDYYKISFILGLIYDLLYSHLFLFHAFLFLLCSKIDSKILKNFKENIILLIALVVINIILYDTILFLLIKFTNYNVVNINDLLYKVKNSMLLNIMSSFIYYFLFKKQHIKHNI